MKYINMKSLKISFIVLIAFSFLICSKAEANPALQNILASMYNTLNASQQYKMRTNGNVYATTTPCGIQLTISSTANSSMTFYVYRDTSPTMAAATMTSVPTSYANYQTPWNSNPGGSVYLHIYTDPTVAPNTTYYYKIRYSDNTWSSVVSAKSNTPNTLSVDWWENVYPYSYFAHQTDSGNAAYYANACRYIEPMSVNSDTGASTIGWGSVSLWSSVTNPDFSCSGAVTLTWPKAANVGYYWDIVYSILPTWYQYGYWRLFDNTGQWGSNPLVYKNGDNVKYNVYEVYSPIYTAPYNIGGLPQYSTLRPTFSLLAQNVSSVAGQNRVSYTATHKPVAPANYEFTGYAITAVQNSSQTGPIYIDYWQPASCSTACVSPSTFDQTKPYTFTTIDDFDANTPNVIGLNSGSNGLQIKNNTTSSTSQQWYIKPSAESMYAQIVSKATGKAIASTGSITWGAYDSAYGASFTLSPQFSYTNNMYPNTPGEPLTLATLNTSDDSQKWCLRKNDLLTTGGATSYLLVNKKTQSILSADTNSGGTTAVGNALVGQSYDYRLPWSQLQDELDAANYMNYNGTLAAYIPPYQGNAPSLWVFATSTTRSCTVGTTTLADGVSQTFYNSASSPTCSSQVRTCTDGTMSGTSQYTYPSCALSCTKPDGTTLLSGNTSDYWIKDQSTNCSADKRTLSCSNGTLTGTSATYYTSCTPLAVGIPATTINSFLVKPALVSQGDKCSLFWNISTSTTCTIKGTNSYNVTLQSVAGDNTITPNNVSNRTKYTLTCGGNNAVKTAVCSVVPGYKEF